MMLDNKRLYSAIHREFGKESLRIIPWFKTKKTGYYINMNLRMIHSGDGRWMEQAQSRFQSRAFVSYMGG
jgi:hypothetical protein